MSVHQAVRSSVLVQAAGAREGAAATVGAQQHDQKNAMSRPSSQSRSPSRSASGRTVCRPGAPCCARHPAVESALARTGTASRYIPASGSSTTRPELPSGIIRPYATWRDLEPPPQQGAALLSTRRVVMDTGAVDDISKLEEEMARPDSIIEKARKSRPGKSSRTSSLLSLTSTSLVRTAPTSARFQASLARTWGCPPTQPPAWRFRPVRSRNSIITTVFFDNDTLARQLEVSKSCPLCEVRAVHG